MYTILKIVCSVMGFPHLKLIINYVEGGTKMAKKTKLITCKHCGKEIAASAKTCPNCGGKNKKPFYKKVWFWVIVVIILFAAISSSGSKDSSSDNKKIGEVSSSSTDTSAESNSTSKDNASETTSDTSSQASEENVKTVYNVGDILHDGNMDIVYISSGDYDESNQFLQPSDGNKYIFLNFAFINTSDTSDSSISFYSFECYADGYACDAYYGGDDNLSATLSAGRSTTGSVYFEVPTDAKEIEVEYETNYFTQKKITFTFEGNQDSGYVLEKNTSATEGALNVGETIEGKSLNITYISCYEDTSYSSFSSPKDGYTYVTCEFEFENVSSSDITVSYFSFDCYADGVNCDTAYFRDDAISAKLSAGRKAKGTVTFEVPKNADVVEVEYLTNYWTSNRVVFNASDM
jgi:RNA polymerase subunit RPABC4/transcription elongation factor Spt4